MNISRSGFKIRIRRGNETEGLEFSQKFASSRRRLHSILQGTGKLAYIVLMARLMDLGSPATAQILSGFITNYQESAAPPALTFGDGMHSVTLWWSVNNLNSSGFFYAGSDTQVAIATNISSINQITDASRFAFTTGTINSYFVGPVSDVPVTGGLNSFVVLHNTVNGYYGVVRLDDIFRYPVPIDNGWTLSYSGLNATWWFQAGGTADFSAVPEPSVMSLAGGLTAASLFIMRRRKRVCPSAREVSQIRYQYNVHICEI